MDLGALPSGLSLTFATESFAMRALLGSLAAVALTATLVGLGAIRSLPARRALVLAPLLTAVVAGAASVGEAFLPQLRVATAGLEGGPVLEYVGEYRSLTGAASVDILLLLWGLVAAVLVARRLLGLLTWRRILAPARPAAADDPRTRTVAELAHGLGVAPPRLLLQRGCPGGAFTGGLRDPVIVVDPDLLARLDAAEQEGLLAHELAHVARRDNVVGLVAGLARDLGWFLVPLHLAAGWLRREQEEGADEAASAVTGRPAALASGILKVYGAQARPAPRAACAMASSRSPRSGRRSGRQAGLVTARIERLIERRPAPSRLRRTVEGGVVGAVLGLAAVATVGLPSWIASDLATDELALLYLSGPPAATAEAPALQTFRALAPKEPVSEEPVSEDAAAQEEVADVDDAPTGAAAADASRLSGTGAPAETLGASREDVPAPTGTSAGARVETRAEMEQGARQEPPADRLAWRDGEREPWELGPPGEVSEARALVSTRGDTGAEVGVFVLSSDG